MTPDARVAELLATFDRPDLNLAELLCDRHPADAVAFTVVQPDLSSVASPRWVWSRATGSRR